MITALVDAESGELIAKTPPLVIDDTRIRATVHLSPGQTITVVVASLTSYDVHADAFATDPLRAKRVSSGVSDPAVASATLSLLNSTVARLSQHKESIIEAHRRSWREFWNASKITIASPSASSDTDGLDAPLALLEANYYGSQYILQSAGRIMGTGSSGRIYPSVLGVSSLFGPFSTSDYIGW